MLEKSNLLLVEDESVFSRALALQLEEQGFTVFCESSGERALEYLRKHGAATDLVLMDIDLGTGMDGVQAAFKIQEAFRLPVIFLSAHAEKDVLDKTIETACYGILPKNSPVTVLSASVRMALRLHGAYRELRAKEEALREKDLIFSEFLEYSPIYVFFKDENLRSLKLSRNYENMLGKPLKELLGKNMDELFPSELARAMMEDDRKIIQEGKLVKVVEELNGRIYETLKFPIIREGRPDMLAGFTMDITEQRQAQTKLSNSLLEKEILFKELQHRVKNNLNVISSLLSYELQQVDDPKVRDVFTSAQARIRSMAGIYEKLYQSHQLGMVELDSYIKDFVETLVKMYQVDGLKLNLKLQLESVQLDLKRAVSLGLILNELISNALKYAFSGRELGELLIQLFRRDSKLVLKVRDDGAGMPPNLDWRQGKSLGFLLVNMLSAQIDGHLEFQSGLGEGTSFQLEFPEVE